MGKQKIILLPDDERILDLFKGNMGAEKEHVEIEIPTVPAGKKNRRGLLWYEVLIEKTVVVVLVPFILLAIVVLMPTVLIGYVILGKKSEAFEAKCFERLELFHKLIPFRNRGNQGKKYLWKGVEEDVPAMLEKAKKFNYQIVLYVKNTEAADYIKIENLISNACIDKEIKYNNENELLTYIENENVCQLRSWIIAVPEPDIQLSTEVFKNICNRQLQLHGFRQSGIHRNRHILII